MPKLIYVADDEKNICFLIQNFLEKEGFQVRCFEDGESILAACEEKMPDLCILDVMMPGIDGSRSVRRSGKRAMSRSLSFRQRIHRWTASPGSPSAATIIL